MVATEPTTVIRTRWRRPNFRSRALGTASRTHAERIEPTLQRSRRPRSRPVRLTTAAFRPPAVHMSVQLGKDVFAEESYLFDEIGQACHLAVRPRFECQRVGEGEKRMVQSGGA